LILERAVDPGARVKKGEVIAEFDRLSMLTRLDDYRAELDQQAANLISLKANLEVEQKAHQQSIEAAKATLEKARYDLKTIPVQSAIASEQLKLAEAEAAARYKQLLAEVRFMEVSQQADWKISSLQHDQNEIEFKRSQANADRMLFRAPIDGIVVMGNTFRGGEFAQIRAGDQVRPGMMFMRVVDPSSMVVNASINQTDMDLLRVGARARVRFDAYPDLELPGRVHAIAAMPRSGGFRPEYVREVPVVIKLERLDPRVVPDLSVSVDVVLESEPGGVRVPREAIFTEPAGGGHCVYVRGAAGWERRPVELGLTNNVAAIGRTGVQPRETVALQRPLVERAAAKR
jgi:HlyD family secretion protein